MSTAHTLHKLQPWCDPEVCPFEVRPKVSNHDTFKLQATFVCVCYWHLRGNLTSLSQCPRPSALGHWKGILHDQLKDNKHSFWLVENEIINLRKGRKADNHTEVAKWKMFVVCLQNVLGYSTIQL